MQMLVVAFIHITDDVSMLILGGRFIHILDVLVLIIDYMYMYYSGS